MISVVNYDRSIDAEGITWLFGELNKIKTKSIYIYLRSEGGDAHAASSLIHYINETHVDRQITLIGARSVSSAAFDIMWLTKCPKKLLEGTYAVLHFTDLETTKKNVEGKDKFYEALNEVSIKEDNALYEFLRKSKQLSAQELKNLKEYKDVVVNYTRLKKILSIT